MSLVDLSSSENQTGYLFRYILSDCSLKLYTVIDYDRLIEIKNDINRVFLFRNKKKCMLDTRELKVSEMREKMFIPK